MKTKKYLVLACCLSYMILSVSIYYGVDKTIDRKVHNLKEEAISNLNSFFETQPEYVDLLYGPYDCSYKEIEIPQPQEADVPSVINYINANPTLTYDEAETKIQQNLMKAWERQYGNYRKLYELDIYPTEDGKIMQTGWAIKVICKKPAWATSFKDGIETFLIFPKQIAFKKTSSVLYMPEPSVETILQNSLDFSLKDEKSNLQPYYNRGCTYNLISRMESVISNEYYLFNEDTDYGKISYGDGYSSFTYGGMHNGFYEVIYHRTQPTTYSITFVGDEIVQSDKNSLTIALIGLLTIIMSGAIFLIVKKQVK